MAEQKLDVVISAKNLTGPTFAEVGANLRKLKTESVRAGATGLDTSMAGLSRTYGGQDSEVALRSYMRMGGAIMGIKVGLEQISAITAAWRGDAAAVLTQLERIPLMGSIVGILKDIGSLLKDDAGHAQRMAESTERIRGNLEASAGLAKYFLGAREATFGTEDKLRLLGKEGLALAREEARQAENISRKKALDEFTAARAAAVQMPNVADRYNAIRKAEAERDRQLGNARRLRDETEVEGARQVNIKKGQDVEKLFEREGELAKQAADKRWNDRLEVSRMERDVIGRMADLERRELDKLEDKRREMIDRASHSYRGTAAAIGLGGSVVGYAAEARAAAPAFSRAILEQQFPMDPKLQAQQAADTATMKDSLLRMLDIMARAGGSIVQGYSLG